jgi:hypothetical protein
VWSGQIATNVIIIINISRRSSLEEVNHVKSIGQKYRSNGALGNFDRSPNPRTQGKPRTRGPWGPVARSSYKPPEPLRIG